MRIEGDYARDGYALVRELIPGSVARAFLAQMRRALRSDSFDLSQWPLIPLLNRPALDVYSQQFPFMRTFLWGLTPAMEMVTGARLVPTYDYFRVYRQGDVCKVHSDRPACEHSLSLTLGYSDGKPWPLEIEREAIAAPREVAEDFGGAEAAALEMQIGDAVAYRGVEHRHGRVTPNPNRWSAHLFLHWVDRDGEHAAEAFDKAGEPPAVEFNFA